LLENTMHARKREPSSKRNFIAKMTPPQMPAEMDTSAPVFGQRKRPKKRRPVLSPNPVKAD
jgi:hypothetical protein